jgi:hypothetical protein
MHQHTIKGMLRALRPMLKDNIAAQQRLERYWLDKIAIVWTTEDVHRAANERELALTEEEATHVLQRLLDRHDAQYGLKWADITAYIEDRVLGRKLTKREVDAFVHRDIITIQKSTKRRKRP